jgi:hypothetical protein
MKGGQRLALPVDQRLDQAEALFDLCGCPADLVYHDDLLEIDQSLGLDCAYLIFL